MSCRVVPWRRHEDLLQLKKLLFSDKKKEVERALEMVEMFKSRGKIPISIDMSVNLVKILQLRGVRSEEELQDVFAINIIRFVNGILDQAQQGVFAISLNLLAKRINLPGYFVEVRHNCTHDDRLPCYEVLEKCVVDGLAWLVDNYWEVKRSEYNSEEFRKLIKQYKLAKKQGDDYEPIVEEIQESLSKEGYSIIIKEFGKVKSSSFKETFEPVYEILDKSELFSELLKFDLDVVEKFRLLEAPQAPQAEEIDILNDLKQLKKKIKLDTPVVSRLTVDASYQAVPLGGLVSTV